MSEMPSGKVLSSSEDLPIRPDLKPSFQLNAAGNCGIAFAGAGKKLVLLELK